MSTQPASAQEIPSDIDHAITELRNAEWKSGRHGDWHKAEYAQRCDDVLREAIRAALAERPSPETPPERIPNPEAEDGKPQGERAEPPAAERVCQNCKGDGLDGEPSDGFAPAVIHACEVCNGSGRAPALPAEMPLLPGHPEPQVMTWSTLEMCAITEYGTQCYEAGRLAERVKTEALRAALDALLQCVYGGRLIPLDEESSGYVNATVANAESALDAALAALKEPK